jgi:hypothetical protein
MPMVNISLGQNDLIEATLINSDMEAWIQRYPKLPTLFIRISGIVIAIYIFPILSHILVFLFKYMTPEKWNWVFLFVLLAEMINYYLANKKVKDYISYCLIASSVNLMTVDISYYWYSFLHFYFSADMLDFVFEFGHASSSDKKWYQISVASFNRP